MTTLVHLRRYGKKPAGAEVATIDVISDGRVVYKGSAYDLRIGDKLDKHPGFAHALDGRYLEWRTSPETYLEVHHPDGKVAKVFVRGGNVVGFVGPYLVYNDDARQPWSVFEASTGKELGRITDMRGDASFGTTLYNAQHFDPRNGRTLWLCESTRLAELDIAKRSMVRTIEAPADHALISCAALASGHVVTLMRTLKAKAAHSRTGDRLVLFGPDGKRMRDVPGEVMYLSTLGDNFIISDDRGERFAIYDSSLELVASIPMFEPGGDAFNRIVRLPSGREWISVGGRGEWDHYGEPSLGPPVKPKPAPKAKPAPKGSKAPKPTTPASKAPAKSVPKAEKK